MAAEGAGGSPGHHCLQAAQDRSPCVSGPLGSYLKDEGNETFLSALLGAHATVFGRRAGSISGTQWLFNECWSPTNARSFYFNSPFSSECL